MAAVLQNHAQTGAGDENASGANYGLFVAPKNGMSSVVAALVARLPPGSIRLNCAVRSLARGESRSWRVEASGSEEFDDVILAVPSHRAAQLLAELAPPLAADLASIPYASSSIVILAVRAEQLAEPIDYFGIIVPAIEKRRILAASFASMKFPGRAPEGHHLVRVFIGGALAPQLATLPDDALFRLAVEELAELAGLCGEPELLRVTRWPAAMPQYHVGHCELVARIEASAAELGVHLAGSAYRGVGAGHCIKSGERAAESVIAKAGAATMQDRGVSRT